MKTFDYMRTPTPAKIRVTFSNGEVYDVPAQIVADDRDVHYVSDQEDTIGFIRDGSLDKYALLDWVSNNMNWSDLASHAVKVEVPRQPFDYESDWGNADKSLGEGV